MSDKIEKKSTEFGCWTLSEIIEGRYFRVPDYQRGYAWGARQLGEFWDDILAVAESGGKHYTGAITVKKLLGHEGTAASQGFEVVDGQQRLTTMAVLLAAINAQDNPFVKRSAGAVDYVFAYEPQNIDSNFFCNILSGEIGMSPENAHQRNLKEAFKFFDGKIKEADREDFGRKIFDVLMDHLTFDFRIIGADYNVGVVFETMNNRGKPLTLLEKLKNRLMYLVDTLPQEDAHDDDRICLRRKINEAWGRIYQLLASDPEREPLDEDEFVAAHLSVYRASKESVYSKTVAESRLFKMFCIHAERYPKSERIDESDEKAMERSPREEPISIGKIQDYVEDVAAFAEPWKEINNDYSSAAGRCRLISATQEVKAFLATVRLHVADNVSVESIFLNAERILFRNTIKSIMDESAFVTLARRLHGKCLDVLKKGERDSITAEDVEKSLHDVLKCGDEEKNPIDVKDIVGYFEGRMSRSQQPYGFYGWSGLKYFLFTREDGDGLSWNKFDNSSLEHIMPQSSIDSESCWWHRQVKDFTERCGYGDEKLLTNKQKIERRQCERKLVNSLGNFVLLTQPENASVSDDPWECYAEVPGKHKTVVGKKNFYSDPKRDSSTGARAVARDNDRWNAYRIRERGRKLFRELAESLGVDESVRDEDCDIALGFGDVKSLDDTIFNPLDEPEVNQLAPKLGTAAESKRSVGVKVEDGNPRAKLCANFWKELLSKKEFGKTVYREVGNAVHDRPYIEVNSNYRNIKFAMVFNTQRAQIECNFYNEGQSIYQKLKMLDIDCFKDICVQWQDVGTRSQNVSRIYMRVDSRSIDSEEDRAEIKEWLCTNAPKFIDALNTAIKGK